MTIADIRCI